eukprot:1090241-Rhodomonas_salina.1
MEALLHDFVDHSSHWLPSLSGPASPSQVSFKLTCPGPARSVPVPPQQLQGLVGVEQEAGTDGA